MRIAIIGGSIAGLECAIRLSSHHDVTLFEEHREIGYPLQCGEGWIRAIEPYGCVSKEINVLRARFIDFDTFRVLDEVTLDVGGRIVTLDRPEMEKRMAKMAEERGCEIVLGRKVKISELCGDYDIIIDASGHPSQWDREFGVKRKGGVAIQARCKLGGEEMILDFCGKIDGFFWVFPKANGEANVGVGFWRLKPPVGLRTKLEEYVEFVGGKVLWMTGGTLGVGLNRPFVRYRNNTPVALVGDAAGMVDPFLGEGMTKSVLAARLLAACINERGLEGLEEYERTFVRGMRTYYAITSLMYRLRRSRVGFKIVKRLMKFALSKSFLSD